MERKKIVVGTVASIIMLLTIFTSLTITRAVDPNSWYITVNGVLDSDYYLLYPFEKNSVKYGFSKYGELLGIPAGADPNVQTNWIGMEYGGRDPFAPADTVPMASWINGWYITISYIDPTASVKDRNLFAFAMFADGNQWGGNWTYASTPDGEPHGGRKTNGYCVTEDLQILYNGPRRFVAKSVTHIYDKEGTTTWQVVDLEITMIFNKVKKEVILLKDVKIKIPKMHLYDKLNIQLSNREEYDLGPSPGYSSFAHFYEQEGLCCYGPDWHYAKNLTRDTIEHQTGDGSTKTFTLSKQPVASGFLKVYVNGVFRNPTVTPPPYTVDWATGTVTFTTAPADGADIEFHYKYIFKTEEEEEQLETWDHKYDIAQVISSDRRYVAWTAFWPCVSDYTVDGILNFLQPLIETKVADMSVEPKQSPLIIGEWDFLLDHAYIPMFRAVEVKGICNWHDADDANARAPYWNGVQNKIDIEAWYQLDEIFLPWDLYQAVHKDTTRWVQFYTVTTEDVYYASLGYPLKIYLDNAPVTYAPVWEQYCTFSERVIWGNALKYPIRSVYSTYHYELVVNETTGVGYINIPYNKVPAAGTEIKILYSTDTYYAYNVTENPISLTFESEETPANGVVELDWSTDDTWVDYLGAEHTVEVNGMVMLTKITAITRNATFTLTGSFNWFGYDFKVFKEDYTWLGIWDLHLPPQNITVSGNTTEIDPSDFDIKWTVDGPTGLDLHVEFLDAIISYNFTAIYNTETGNYTIYITIDIEPYYNTGILYEERIPGRYEWTIVGRDAYTSDVLGATLVTAAFKNKQVEIGNAGLDMMLYEWSYVSIPYVMNCFGTAPGARSDYKDNGETPGQRPAIKDDWCTTWPVSSSNMIGVGGPIANVLTLYFNEFTDAFWGSNTWLYGETYTPYETWQDKIVALTCWNGTKKGYGADVDTGYAVIATYKDINGTVGFLIWGIGPRDTFYASQFFHEEIIFELQSFPRCVTSIIIEIDYTDPEHPTFSILECLGTISETRVEVIKGGIHDP